MKRSFSILISFTFVFAALIGVYLVIQPAAQAAPQDITPIATARAAGPGWTGGIEGNVVVPPGVYGPYYFVIQDATGGMYMYVQAGGPSIPTMALGDVVQVTGTLPCSITCWRLSPVTAISIV